MIKRLNIKTRKSSLEHLLSLLEPLLRQISRKSPLEPLLRQSSQHLSVLWWLSRPPQRRKASPKETLRKNRKPW